MVFPTTADLVGAALGVILTLMVFSYLLGDNPTFRFSIHLFIGVSAGLAAAVALRNVIFPYILLPLLDFSDPFNWLWSFMLLVLGILVLLKLSPRFRKYGNFPIAYITGVGAAVVVSGAVIGTIFPQIAAATDLFNLGTLPSGTPLSSLLGLLNRFLAIVGTVTALAYFHFSARSVSNTAAVRNRVVEYAARVGQVFIAATFGVLFAGVFSAALSAWVERWSTIVEFLTTISAAIFGS